MHPNRFESRTRRAVRWTFVASIISMSGIELVLPSLPEMQSALGLTDADVALIMTAYLLPGVLVTIPAGAAADARGTRPILVIALFTLGVSGAGLVLARSLPLILALRAVQGLAAGAIAPLTISYIGILTDGRAQLKAHAHRSLLMTVGSAALPIVGGLVASVHWSMVFALQTLAIPAAFGLWSARARVRQAERQRVALLPERPDQQTVAIYGLSLLRFIALYAFLTFLPLALSRFSFSPLQIGLALGAAATAGVGLALLSSGLVRRIKPSVLLQCGLIVAGAGLIMLAPTASSLWLVVGGCVFGAGDGLHGVLQNSFLTRVGNPASRNSTVAVAAMAKNIGKVLGPGLVLGTSGVIGHAVAFTGLGLALCLSSSLAVVLRGQDDAVSGHKQTD